MEAPPALGRYRRELDAHLRTLLSGRRPPLLYRMLRYHLGWEDAQGHPADSPGKALRPALSLLACEAAGGNWRQALPAAAAVELVHNFSLVHDDIQDHDRERRHRPTVWAAWGEGQAINAGDALAALARIAVLGLADAGVPQGEVVEAARILEERTLEMVEGQVMDLSFEKTLDISLDDYLEMIGKKTGALFDCSLRLGALVAGADAAAAEAMGRCGRLLGIAFQARDDLLGVWAAAERTGKAAAADIRRRKKSLPIVFALTGNAGSGLRRVYAKPELGNEDAALVLRVLDEVGARASCERLAEERLDAALAQLDGLPLRDGPARELRDAASFLVCGDY